MKQNESQYNIEQSISERITVFKLLLSIMIVFIHADGDINEIAKIYNINYSYLQALIMYILSESIARCAVPAFFMLSAIMLYRKQFIWYDNLKKKIRTILLPYIILNTLWLIILYVYPIDIVLFKYVPMFKISMENWQITEWLAAYGMINLIDMPAVFQLWFLRDLFLLNVCSVLIKKLIDMFPKLVLCAVLFLWIFVSVDDNLTRQAFVFWCLGYLVVYYKISLNFFNKWKILLVVSYITLLAGKYVFINTPYLNIIHALICICGIVTWFVITSIIKHIRLKKILLYIASFNFSIYLFHEPILLLLNNYCAINIEQTPSQLFGEYLVNTIVAIIVSFLIGVMLKKYVSILYSFITGNRYK